MRTAHEAKSDAALSQIGRAILSKADRGVKGNQQEDLERGKKSAVWKQLSATPRSLSCSESLC